MLTYRLSLDPPSSHLFHVEIELNSDGADHVDLEFPAWSPGRYYIYDFARNVQELSATGGGDGPLPVEKIAKGTWRIGCAGSRRDTTGLSSVWRDEPASTGRPEVSWR